MEPFIFTHAEFQQHIITKIKAAECHSIREVQDGDYYLIQDANRNWLIKENNNVKYFVSRSVIERYQPEIQTHCQCIIM